MLSSVPLLVEDCLHSGMEDADHGGGGAAGLKGDDGSHRAGTARGNII